MFTGFAWFWIKNSKLTFVIIFLILCAGILSRILIPKQYNPSIVVPAFQITVPAPGFSSDEVWNLITIPLENKLMEIEWVEHVYGYTNRNFGSVMVSFFVWVDKEKATTRLYNKVFSNMNYRAIWVQQPTIQAIDSDEIPIYSFAITSNKTTDDTIKLRKIWLDILEKIKLVEDTSVLYLVGWDKENINIKLDLNKLEANNIDILQVHKILQQNNANSPGGDFKIDKLLWQINIEWSLNTIDKIKKLIITNNWKYIYLEDIATIYKWVSTKKYSTLWWNLTWNYQAVYIWVAKKKGTNAVSVVNNIEKELKKIEKQLPVWYSIKEVQNEGSVAKKTTNLLIINLFQSIFIIILILSIFMGTSNAINTAISIPLTLSVIFLYALIVGDNINRITLFALILVLWMLVDDATVVVENLNRHLKMREKTWKSKLDAIFDAISEVELWVILSTITRLLAFSAMFFVTGMMWEYMWPIPKYAIVAMISSTVIALSINPFLAYYFAKDVKLNEEDNKKNKIGKNIVRDLIIKIKVKTKLKTIDSIIVKFIDKLNFKKRYMDFLNKYLGREKIYKKRRQKFKIVFWVLLLATITLPPYFYVFKWRMLPKSNQNQIYIWIDTPASMNLSWTNEVARDVQNFMKSYMFDEKKKDNSARIVKDINYWIGTAPILDFSNLFRGVANRVWENYISMRVNLVSPKNRELSSEDFVIKIRPIMRDALLSKHPNLKIRLLEDPPWPPVRATFVLEVAWNDNISYDDLIKLEKWLKSKLHTILVNGKWKDIENTIEQYKTNYIMSLKHELISRLGLSVEQVTMSLYDVFQWSEISIYHDNKTKEPVNIFLSVLDKQKYDLQSFDRISFMNNQWERVPLKEIADIVLTRADTVKYSDDRIKTVYLYGEMWNNSVIYPIIKIIKSFSNDKFWEWKYSIVSSSLYWFKIKDNLTNKEYYLNFGWEWELTMDTFKDMGLAMVISFLAIFFMMVAQFKSFKTGGAIMVAFLLWFFGIFPGFSILYLLNNVYFSATSMIWVIALAGIVVGNAIILVEYINILVKRWVTLKMAVINASLTRMKPILVTSLTTILWATTILWDPVWSGVAWAIIWWLTASAILTVTVLPLFIYDAMFTEEDD